MENAPTGNGSDLLTILRTFKNYTKSRGVNNFLKRSDVDAHSKQNIFDQPELRLAMHCAYLQVYDYQEIISDTRITGLEALRPEV